MGPALPAGLGGKRCPCMGQVALGCSEPWCCGCGGWGVTDGSMCPWGPAAGAGGQQVLHVLPDPIPCIPVGAGATGAGPWYSSHSLQSWVLLSMRPAKPGDCFRGISGIPCSESLASESQSCSSQAAQAILVCLHCHISRVWGLVLPWVVFVCSWALPRLGWAGARHSTRSCSMGTPPKGQPEESGLGCCGTAHSRREWD